MGDIIQGCMSLLSVAAIIYLYRQHKWATTRWMDYQDRIIVALNAINRALNAAGNGTPPAAGTLNEIRIILIGGRQ